MPSPFIIPINAAGARSRPGTISSWKWISPVCSQGATRA
jgi:hypothetical protein